MSASNPQHVTDGGDHVTPIFGLTKSQLRPIVESIVSGETVASFEVGVRHQVRGPYGIRAEKVIPTFSYTTTSGCTGRTTVFVKRYYDPGPREAHHYAYLANHDAPIPRMYASLTGQDQRETLFLEYLDAVTDDDPYYLEHYQAFLHDGHSFSHFLAAIAHFNAIRPSPEYEARLREDMAQRPGPPGWSWERRMATAASVLNRIDEGARRGELGGPLAQLSSGAALRPLCRLAERLVEPIGQMETGLCVNDFYPHGTGWRRQTGELLIFDLEAVGFEARFYDVAPWLGAPDDVQPRCRPRKELAWYYLQQYVRWGGCPVRVDDFLEETRILWLAWTLQMLSWWLGEAINGPVDRTIKDSPEYRLANRDELHRRLSHLIHQRV